MTHPTALPSASAAPALVAGLCAALVGLLPVPALAQRWQLDYRVHVGGVAVLDARAELTLAEGRYTVQVNAATDGFLGRMFPWESQSLSVGMVRPDGVAPIRHTQTGVPPGSRRAKYVRRVPLSVVAPEVPSPTTKPLASYAPATIAPPSGWATTP